MLLHRRFAIAHQSADRCRGGVEDIHLVLGHHLPEAPGIGPARHAFKHQRGRAIRERAIDNIAVPGHPADIGGAPINLTITVIEDFFMRVRCPNHIAAGGVQHALGLARAA